MGDGPNAAHSIALDSTPTKERTGRCRHDSWATLAGEPFDARRRRTRAGWGETDRAEAVATVHAAVEAASRCSTWRRVRARRGRSGDRRRVRRPPAGRHSLHDEMPAGTPANRVGAASIIRRHLERSLDGAAPRARRSAAAALQHHPGRLSLPARRRGAGPVRHAGVDLSRSGDSGVRSADARRSDRQLGHHRRRVCRARSSSAARDRNRRSSSASRTVSIRRAACGVTTNPPGRATSSPRLAPPASASWASAPCRPAR